MGTPFITQCRIRVNPQSNKHGVQNEPSQKATQIKTLQNIQKTILFNHRFNIELSRLDVHRYDNKPY